jgi:hypothetical protein
VDPAEWRKAVEWMGRTEGGAPRTED